MDPRQTLTAALRGKYEIVREIGAGGMATVFLAKDLRHDRDVALKLLKPELGAVLGVERFLSEIKTTAKLQHPHILPLLDSGGAEGLLFYVMPFVEGESLRARLDRDRQLPIREALRIATEVTSALDYAHRHGVIHRDIKPENILLHDGQALVADFGIALAVQSAGGQRMTQTGLSLGTPQYMSPEQAMGEKTVDARSDIYALGAVTYEMLAGDAPFTGSSVQAIVAKVLNERPTPLRTLRDTVSPGVEQAVLTALAKLPADRFATAKEFGDALAGAATATLGTPLASPHPLTGARARLRDPVSVGLATLVAVVGGLAVWGWSRETSADAESIVRFAIDIPRYVSFGGSLGSGIAVSPDGRTIAFVGGSADASAQRILLRSIDDPQPRALPGTESSQGVFFAPDGRSIGAWNKGSIMRVPLDGSAPIVLARQVAVEGFSWSPRGLIVVTAGGRLATMADTGGATTPIPGSDSARRESYPFVLPDGETVLFISGIDSPTTRSTISAAHLSSGKRTPLGINGSYIVGVVGDLLVYTVGANQLMAVRFDSRQLKVSGPPIQVGTVPSGSPSAKPIVALSSSGTLVMSGPASLAELVKVDSRGSAARVSPEPQAYSHPRFSPDGRRVALSIGQGGSAHVWLYDLAAQTFSQFTDEPGGRAEWSTDGKRVIYNRSTQLYWRPTDMSAAPSAIFSNPNAQLGGYWEGVMTPDGRGLVIQRDQTGADVIFRSLAGDTTPVEIAATPNEEFQARPSPDGKWVAFQSNSPAGTSQVFVKSITGAGEQIVVSPGSGTEPVWSRDRRHLYYRDGQQFVEVTYTATPDFRVVSRTPLFSDVFLAAPVPHANYDVYPDGSGILALRPTGNRQLIVTHNWRVELERLMSAAPKN